MSYRSFRRHRSGRGSKRSRKTGQTYARERDRHAEPALDVIAGALGNFIGWLVRLLFSRRSTPPAVALPDQPTLERRDVRRKRATPLSPRSVSGLAPPAASTLPYRRRKHLVSKGERAFWYPLYRAVQGRYRIFCKVRLHDVVCTPDDAPDEWLWFRRIRGYHVDFVLCDPETTAPLLVVELDDRSHGSPKQVERDQFKDAVLAAAGMPVYRVRAQQAYDPKELAEAMARLLDEMPTP